MRDLYDIFFLVQIVKERERVEKSIMGLLQNFHGPEDEKELRAIIISGSAPTVEHMLEAIAEWAR